MDPLTLALWHLDETEGGNAVDSGPRGLGGTVGDGATIASGYAGMARRFSGEEDAFLVAERSWPPRTMEALTAEAYVRVDANAQGELETIAAQWTGRENSSSWYFGLAGSSAVTGLISLAGGSPRLLVFAYVREQRRAKQDLVRVEVSDKPIFPGIWTHVAVTFDGRRVRFYRDHAPDLDPTQEAMLEIQDETRLPDRIQGVETPVTIGTYLEKLLTSRSGNLAYSVNTGVTFDGDVDEVRISQGVRNDLVQRPPR